ncbi:hypothetical protein [Streptomyces avermitilis]|uniref:hypothetical protein n=1 Tax=Streptomyces avermitilis TaxID=33903 RepID=UPI0033B4152F
MVDRPACERVVDARVMAMYEEHLQEAFTPAGGEPPAVWRLGSVMGDQERLFKWRAGDPGGVTTAQLATLRLASQMGAALFHIGLASRAPRPR